jgi:hypothetical protein
MATQPYDLESERQARNPFQAGLNKLLAQALAEKSLLWFSTLVSAGLWGYTIVVHPEPWRLAGAAGYSIISYVALAWRK